MPTPGATGQGGELFLLLDRYSQPHPDVAVLRPRADDYATGHAGPDDVLLIIEVADTTLSWDRNVKAPLYARAGFPELWIVDLDARAVEVYIEPAESGYRRTARITDG